jgi:lipid II:glycine glycyltransferase (peptidoglycan interpeptide bridge formation enzyme)
MLTLKEFIGTEEDWDNFVLSSIGSRAFHQSSWLNIIKSNHNLDLIKLGFYKNDSLVGVLPLFVRKYGLFKIASSPFFVEDTPHLGYVGDNIDINDIVLSTYNYLKFSSIGFARLVQYCNHNNIDPQNYLNIIEKHTHILSLDKSEEILWKNLEGRCRTAVRKAEKTGVAIDFANDVSEMEEYFKILKDVYNRQNLIYPHPLQFFLDIFNKYNGSQLYMLIGRLNGKVIAGGIFLVGPETVFYLNGASLRDFNNTGVNNLLQWKSILHACSLGKKYYDFVGSDMERFGKFKKSFGGELHTYMCLEIIKNPFVGFIRDKYPKFKILCMKYLKKRM